MPRGASLRQRTPLRTSGFHSCNDSYREGPFVAARQEPARAVGAQPRWVAVRGGWRPDLSRCVSRFGRQQPQVAFDEVPARVPVVQASPLRGGERVRHIRVRLGRVVARTHVKDASRLWACAAEKSRRRRLEFFNRTGRNRQASRSREFPIAAIRKIGLVPLCKAQLAPEGIDGNISGRPASSSSCSLIH